MTAPSRNQSLSWTRYLVAHNKAEQRLKSVFQPLHGNRRNTSSPHQYAKPATVFFNEIPVTIQLLANEKPRRFTLNS